MPAASQKLKKRRRSYPSPFLFLFLLSACNVTQAQIAKQGTLMTVIKRHNQTAGSRFASVMLIRDSLVNPSSIDLEFLHHRFDYPQFLPTGGFKQNKFQEKECNWDLYPKPVKCYTYEPSGRVATMKIGAPGMLVIWQFVYDKQGRAVQMGSGEADDTVIEYNVDGTPSGMKVQRGFFTISYDFIYSNP